MLQKARILCFAGKLDVVLGDYETVFLRECVKKGGFRSAEAPFASGSVKQVMPDQLLQEFVAVELADEAASVIVIGDISRIFGENVTDDLIDGIIALFSEGTVDLGEDLLHFLVCIYGYGKFDGIMIQDARLLFRFSLSYTNFPIK